MKPSSHSALAVEVLRQTQVAGYSQTTDEVIASAFAQAYRGLLAGMEETKKCDPPRKGGFVDFQM